MVERNSLYYGDNLVVMSAMPAACVDLIYLDPPFNTKANYTLHAGQNKVPAFDDKWAWQDAHQLVYRALLANKEGKQTTQSLRTLAGLYKVLGASELLAYLLFMQPRLVEMHRILRTSGSLYLHCDPKTSHYLKIVVDSIFGAEQFRNEIVWHYTGGGRSKRYFSRKHDLIFYYARGSTTPFYADAVRVPYKDSSNYAKHGITAKSGKHYAPHPSGTPVDDVWDLPIINPLSKERLGYPTQKPLALLKRILQVSSQAGEVVLDPFCGAGTTLVVAEMLGRRWIGIDNGAAAIDYTVSRLSTGTSKVVAKTNWLPHD